VSPLLSGEFVLADWKAAGLNVASAAKRGFYTVHQSLVINLSAVYLPQMLAA
jgi:mRNA interferase MazF